MRCLMLTPDFLYDEERPDIPLVRGVFSCVFMAYEIWRNTSNPISYSEWTRVDLTTDSDQPHQLQDCGLSKVSWCFVTDDPGVKALH